MPLQAPRVAMRHALGRSAPLSPARALGLVIVAATAGVSMATFLVWLWPAYPALAAAAGSLLAVMPLALLLLRLSGEQQRDRRLALTAGAMDPATGVASRVAFMSLAEREFARSRRYGIGAGLLLVDIDRFRQLSDSLDPVAGDVLLREAAACIQATLRGADALARFGPAQVAVFLAHADPLGALDVAERIRDRIEHLEVLWGEQRLRATVSVGAVLMRPAHLALQAVIDDAEAALGAARQAGGNCVRAAPVDARRAAQPGHGPSVDGSRQAGN